MDTLLAASLTVFVIPPWAGEEPAVARYGSAGNTDDRFDAYVLADVVRTDARRLHPMVFDSEQTTALRSTTRARKDLVIHRVAAANQLRAHLQVVFPTAATLFADIDSAITLSFLERFTPQEDTDWLTVARLATWLKKVHSRSNASCGSLTAAHCRTFTSAPTAHWPPSVHTSC